MPFPSKRQSRAWDVEVWTITLRRIRVYDAICAHKRQENFERYVGMKGQKPSAGWARENRERGIGRGGRWNSPIIFHLVERNVLYNICNGPRLKISPPMETELVLRPLGIIHERLQLAFRKRFNKIVSARDRCQKLVKFLLKHQSFLTLYLAIVILINF